ncbi:hypothetical protein AAFN46_08910 [Pseudomonas sp. CAU 1711]|uniref:hypothetical protein n=1 Tax=Pseudomonas sp. CAU 1711 TaxID=3140356 RepID=UPI00326195F8
MDTQEATVNISLRQLALGGLTAALIGSLIYYANQPNILSRWIKFYPDGHVARGVMIETIEGQGYEGGPDREEGVSIEDWSSECSITYAKGSKSLSISTKYPTKNSYGYLISANSTDRTAPNQDITQTIQIFDNDLTWYTTTKTHINNFERRENLNYDIKKKRLITFIEHNQKPFSGDFIETDANGWHLLTYKDGKVTHSVTGELEDLLKLRQSEATNIDYTAKAKQQIEEWRTAILQELNLSHLKSTTCEAIDSP